MGNTWNNLVFKKAINEIMPSWIKALLAVNEGMNAIENYESDFDRVCQIYKKIYKEDDLYTIIFNEPKLKDDLHGFFSYKNFEFFCYKVAKCLYECPIEKNYGIEYLEKNDENDLKIINFIKCLLEVYKYSDEYSNSVNGLIENYIITNAKLFDSTSKSQEEIVNNINNVISLYSNMYVQPLFLDKNLLHGEIPATLSNIFVYPTFQVTQRDDINTYTNLEDFISNFISGNLIKKRGTVKIDTLFILGYAGIGKSSLVAKMMFHYINKDKIAKKIFGDNKIICIKLRDVEKGWFNHPDIWHFVYKYFDCELDEKHDLLRDKIIIMDGFDELCIIDNISKNIIQKISGDMESLNSKLIVTSRPGYKDEDTQFENECTIELDYFDYDKRKEWFDRYEKINPVSDEVKFSICNNENDIFGVPLIIYMTATKGIIVTDYKNKWDLFHKLFYDIIYVRGYDIRHSTEIYRNQIYRIISEIAFSMYQTNEFYMHRDKIDDIIDELYGDDSTINVDELKNCYAINTYFKQNQKNGSIEFCHNEIRDFFTCECIIFKLNENIKNVSISTLIHKFQDWFKDQCLNKATTDFLYERLKRDDRNKIDYYQNELKCETIKKAYLHMIDNGFIFDHNSNFTLNEKSKHICEIMYNIFIAVHCIYHSMYLYIIHPDEKIKLYNHKFSNLLLNLPLRNVYLDINEINFKKTYLASSILVGLDLSNSCFEDANLDSVDLSASSLLSTNFKHATLNGADLSKADFDGANLSGAKINEADLTKASLASAVLNEAQIIKSNLSYADLSGAFLKNSDLTDSDLSGANFEETIMTQKTYDTCNFSGALNVDTIIIED